MMFFNRCFLQPGTLFSDDFRQNTPFLGLFFHNPFHQIRDISGKIMKVSSNRNTRNRGKQGTVLKNTDREKQGFSGGSGSSGHHSRYPPSKLHQTGSFSSLIIALFNQISRIWGYFERGVFQSAFFATWDSLFRYYSSK
jgi:hypothetical protein